MAVQTSVDIPARALPGDYAGLPLTDNAKVFRVNTNTTLTIGNFAYQTFNSNDFVQSTKADPNSGTASNHIAGVILRDNVNVWSNAVWTEGYNYNLVPGQRVQVLPQGNVFVSIAAIVAAVTNPQFTQVFSRDTDGAAVIGVTTETGYTATNFVVTDPGPIVAGQLVRISNVENTANV